MTIHDQDWTYVVYDRETPPQCFGEFSPLIDLWNSRGKHQGETFVPPKWRDFELEDFAGWYGQLSMAEIPSDRSEMVHRLWGTRITDWWGRDFTNRTMKDESLPDHWDEIERPYINALLDNTGVGLCGGALHVYGREFINVRYVDLPLDHDGESSRVLSVYSDISDLRYAKDSSPIYEFIERG